ncbi:MAG: sugar ABC transporter permease [Candidatus Hydromicrobium sp.]|nr:sugar ABC transporter permease [Candidatus Hydromicrobium sp.]
MTTDTRVLTRMKRSWGEVKRKRWAYAFISPFYILFAIFSVYPIIFSIYLSFTEWKGMGPKVFVGLENYRRLLGDSVFWQSIRNGVILFFLYVPIMTLLALVLAVILNAKFVRFFQVFRTMIFIPYITTMIAAGFVFRMMMNMKYGFFNILLTSIGIPPVPWLENVWWARISLSLLVIWAWLGYNMVIMLAGLQTISKDLVEAATIDGANPVQAFFRITVPLMKPIILFCVILSTIGSFGLFSEVYSLTVGGRPMNATLTPIVYIWQQAFQHYKFSYASAVSYVYFAIIIVLTLLQLRYFGREE